MLKLRKRLKKALCEDETFELLNCLTLDIKDPIVRKKFDDIRV